MHIQWPALWLGLRVAACASAAGLIAGLPCAFFLATRRSLAARASLVALGLLLATPVVIVAGLLLRPAFAWPLAAIAGVFSALPLVALGCRRTLADLNAAYGNAARALASPEWRILARILAPLAWRTILVFTSLAFTRVLIEWSILVSL
jgi:ABC-type molybdate transport system permease subunit